MHGKLSQDGVLGVSQSIHPQYTGSTYNLPLVSKWTHTTNIDLPHGHASNPDIIPPYEGWTPDRTHTLASGVDDAHAFTSTGILRAASGSVLYSARIDTPQNTWDPQTSHVRVDFSDIHDTLKRTNTGAITIFLHTPHTRLKTARITLHSGKEIALPVEQGTSEQSQHRVAYILNSDGTTRTTFVSFSLADETVPDVRFIDFFY